MDVEEIRLEICGLKEDGSTTYENCERLITLCEAMRYLAPDEYSKEYGTSNEHFSRRGYSQSSVISSSLHDMNSDAELTSEMAQEWGSSMKNEDGTTGPHWTMEQTESIQKKQGIDCDPVKFWTALNATYSDLCNVFRKHNINNIGAYIDFATAFWLEDKDAVKDKLASYYKNVVEH